MYTIYSYKMAYCRFRIGVSNTNDAELSIRMGEVVRMSDSATKEQFLILTINPGSTSTKLAAFRGREKLSESEAPNSDASPDGANISAGCGGSGQAKASGMAAQLPMRTALILEFLSDAGLDHPDAVVGRGGFINPKTPCRSGVYQIARVRDGRVEVDERMISDVLERPQFQHAANLGIPLAAEIAQRFVIPAFTVDPVVVDDFSPVARISGLKGIERRSRAHVLSLRAAARWAAEQMGLDFRKSRIVGAHLGGGISIAAILNGAIVDANIALLGQGPFTPERVGSLPSGDLVDLCFSRKHSRDEIVKLLTKKGGLVSYLGTNDIRVIQGRITEGDAEAELVLDAMGYQIAKEIGAQAAALGGGVDAIVLTGGAAYSDVLLRSVTPRISWIAPVLVLPGSVEMQAMADGALRVLSGEEEVVPY